MSDMSSRQRRILEFIGSTVRERGYPPTVREIGEAVGLTSSSSVHAQLANLEKAGYLTKDPTKPRAVTLAKESRAEAVAVPVVGRIAAGAPVMAEENIEEYLAVPRTYASRTGHFALRVSGDSMVEAGILDGDIVVVKQQPSAEEGDIVAALVPGGAEDEATVKMFHRADGRVMLQPQNPRYEAIEMTDGRILGRVVAVLRRM